MHALFLDMKPSAIHQALSGLPQADLFAQQHHHMLWDLPMQDSAGQSDNDPDSGGPTTACVPGCDTGTPTARSCTGGATGCAPAHHWHRVFCAQLAARGGPYPATRYG